MLRDLELSFPDQVKIKEYCDYIGIEFMSTPYSIEDASFLNSLDVNYFKIASADIVDLPLLEFVSKTKRPTLISTGMASLKEIKEAVDIFQINKTPFILMHTTSEYPTKIEDTNIARMKSLFDLGLGEIGFSDHTTNSYGAIMATALGCKFFEKHFTLNVDDQGPDHAASLEPNKFKEYVHDIETAFKVLGSSEFKRTQGEEGMARTSRKSLHFASDLRKNHKLTIEDLVLLRPGSGLMWSESKKVLGRILNTEVFKDTLIRLDNFD
jgi:sialic acid synthase SpsE